MKTNFDKITESPESLAEWLSGNDNDFDTCEYCINYKPITKGNATFFECDCGECEQGITEWLKQPLPMSEQFTDEDVEIAKEIKAKGFNYIAREDIDNRVVVFPSKPTRLAYSWLGANCSIVTRVGYKCFANIKWEDEPILLDDIINSKNIQKTIDK